MATTETALPPFWTVHVDTAQAISRVKRQATDLQHANATLTEENHRLRNQVQALTAQYFTLNHVHGGLQERLQRTEHQLDLQRVALVQAYKRLRGVHRLSYDVRHLIRVLKGDDAACTASEAEADSEDDAAGPTDPTDPTGATGPTGPATPVTPRGDALVEDHRDKKRKFPET